MTGGFVCFVLTDDSNGSVSFDEFFEWMAQVCVAVCGSVWQRGSVSV